MSSYASTEDGTPLYVVTDKGPWGPDDVRSWIVPAASLKDAQMHHGYTRQHLYTRRVRRARVADLDTLTIRDDR